MITFHTVPGYSLKFYSCTKGVAGGLTQNLLPENKMDLKSFCGFMARILY